MKNVRANIGLTIDPSPGCGRAWRASYTGVAIKRAYVDKGYVGHDAPKQLRVYRSGQKRDGHGQIPRELRRRSAIEPITGHLKSEDRLDRNYR